MTETTPDRSLVAQQVKAAIADMFDVDPQTITDETVVDDIPGWDSTTHVGLILDVEEKLGIEFAVDRITTFADVGELIDECVREVATSR